MIDLPISEINWSMSGKEVLGLELEDGIETISKDLILEAASYIEHIEPVKELESPMMPAMAFQEIVKQMKYRYSNVLGLGISNRLAPYQLLSITYQYKNCKVTSLWLDQGVTTVCLCSLIHEEQS